MANPFVDPKRYGGFAVGPIGARPHESTVPDQFVYFASNTREVWANMNATWVKVADLTGAIPWADILNKPVAFPPEEHGMETLHTGTLSIQRVRGHDQHEPAHLRSALMAMVTGKI